MLHVRDDGLADLTIRDLPSLLRPGDILVANDTRVFPAQLQATRGDGADRHHPGPAAGRRRLEGARPATAGGCGSATRWRSSAARTER